jgi:hypothetical protein
MQALTDELPYSSTLPTTDALGATKTPFATSGRCRGQA